MEIIKILKEEYAFYCRNNNVSLYRALKCFLCVYHFRLVVILRIRKLIHLPQFIISNYIIKKFGVEIGTEVEIGKNLRIAHIPGIVIGNGSKLGNNCILFQGILIGQSHGQYPIIGDNVTLCAHSCVLGGENWKRCYCTTKFSSNS